MANFDDKEVRPNQTNFLPRLSLLAFLIFIALVSLLMVWLVQPNRVVATALFRVESAPPTTFSETAAALSKRDFENVKQTQAALLKSDFLLATVMRNPEIASLSILQGASDPVAWLREHLEVAFPKNKDVLAISVPGTEAQSEDLIQLTDAVANAYEDEALSETRQRRLGTRDFLARRLESLNREIKQRVDDYLDIARESGSSIPRRDNDLQRLDTQQIVREANTLQRELETAGPDDANQDSDPPRVKELRDRLKTITDELRTRIEGRPFPEAYERDLGQLQQVAHDMAVKIEKLDIEASRPDRVRQLQQAVIADD